MNSNVRININYKKYYKSDENKQYITMNTKIKFKIIIILIFAFWQTDLCGQVSTGSERTIYIMRAKQLYGSWVKMNLMINDELFDQIKSGHRLIIKTSVNDTLNIQIVYPLIKSYKSKILQITPGSKSEVYIDLFYWGEGYNPFKHSGVLRGPIGSSPEFNIEIVEMNKEEGEQKFNLTEKYKDNNEVLEKKIP